MAVVIRLRKVGGKNKPSFRIVATDIRAPRDGRFLEVLGHYDPVRGRDSVTLDVDRARFWLGRGALPTRTVHNIFKRLKVSARGVSIPSPEDAPHPSETGQA